MRFRLVHFVTKRATKFDAKDVNEYFGDADAIWQLWWLLTRELNFPHVEVYALDGRLLDPSKGREAMIDYHP